MPRVGAPNLNAEFLDPDGVKRWLWQGVFASLPAAVITPARKLVKHLDQVFQGISANISEIPIQLSCWGNSTAECRQAA
jgi:hypothetical protein